ncbi:MAG: cyclic nucleotide-binding domain-containing protein [Deltaproteobacteria bacterium]|nr:cyclic nucleotide-binding domain-containing protein [Deltaproteobacteria bacterium]
MSTMPSKAELKKNLKLLKERLEERPMDLDARMRIARTYRLLNDAVDAVAHYGAVARYLSLAGHPLQAIAVLKELLQVNAKHEESLLFLAKLYARTRAADVTNRGRVAVPIHDPSASTTDGVEALTEGLPQTATGIWRAIRPEPTSELQIIRDADEVGAEIEPDEVDDDNVSELEDSRAEDSGFEDSVLTRVPLFASLDAAAFVSLGHAMVRQRADAGVVVFSPGDAGDSCLVITKGTARVSRMIDGKEVELDRLQPGDVAGIFALVAADVRQARLTAETELEYFEIDRLAVSELVQKHPTARAALVGFVRDRLIASLLLDVPLFSSMTKAEKNLLPASFNEKELADGDELFNAFHENDGLWMVVDGAAVVGDEGETEGKLKELASLRVGDWVACLAGHKGQEAGLTALARGRTVVISLPHKVLAPLFAASGKDKLGLARGLNETVLTGSLRR